MENTLENKAKFFAQYWGQEVYVGKQGLTELSMLHMNKYSIESGVLQLNPLSSITDEDSIEVAYLHWIDYRESKHKVNVNWLKSVLETISQHSVVCDYLRSKGYALPYMGLSVEKQVEYGWVKTI